MDCVWELVKRRRRSKKGRDACDDAKKNPCSLACSVVSSNKIFFRSLCLPLVASGSWSGLFRDVWEFRSRAAGRNDETKRNAQSLAFTSFLFGHNSSSFGFRLLPQEAGSQDTTIQHVQCEKMQANLSVDIRIQSRWQCASFLAFKKASRLRFRQLPRKGGPKA